jgi:hypothetical protein
MRIFGRWGAHVFSCEDRERDLIVIDLKQKQPVPTYRSLLCRPRRNVIFIIFRNWSVSSSQFLIN